MKKWISLFLALLLVFSMTVSAFADHYNGTGTATYNGSTIATDFPSGFAELAPNFQPGDDLTIVITLKNNSDVSTAWYMSNEVIKPFENGLAINGVYNYTLKYNNNVIFSSDSIGGENSAGIQNATGQLKDFFFLGNIAARGSSQVTLEFGIDGETQNNDYWNTLSQLRMRFAVDKANGTYVPPKTADTGDILVWGGVMLACMVGIIVILLTDRKKTGKGVAK